MTKYTYYGPVKQFNNIVANNWYGQTYAATEKKALSNLAYQFKRENGLMLNTRISLPGKVTVAN